jgi:uncharacterized protein YwgA
MKSEKQKISQSLLLLKILREDENIFGRTKLQKQVFLNELRLIQSNLGGLYYKYFRYNYGPFSSDLFTDFTVLGNKGFLHKTTFRLTDRGRYLIDYVEGSIKGYKENSRIFQTVENTTRKYRKYNGTELMKMVYRVEVEPDDMPGQRLQIENIDTFVNILLPELHHLKHEIEFPTGILENIKEELAMAQSTWDSLEDIHANVIKNASRNLMKAVSADPL